MDDAAAYEFYKDPEHLKPAGPWVARRVRPHVSVRYEPPSCGPQTQTVNMASMPYWLRNPDLDDE